MTNDANAATHMQAVDLPSFRSSKRRKVYRRRDASTSPPPTSFEAPVNPELCPPGAALESPIPEEPSVTEIVRQRKAIQRRKAGGIEFFTSKNGIELLGRPNYERESAQGSEAPRAVAVRTVASRFAPQTGQVKEVMDKHMTAYIEAELARRNTPSLLPESHPSPSPYSSDSESQPHSLQPAPQTRAPASLGKLQEIDLGPSARLRNEAATLRAQARLDGTSLPQNDEDDDPHNAAEGKKKKRRPRIRLDKFGRARPPRPPRKERRPSSDMERDRVVEELLRENKFDVEPFLPTNSSNPADKGRSGDGEVGENRGNDEAADERLAEEFRQEFLEGQMAGQKRREEKGKGKNEAGKGGKEEEKTKGPKLGGSRSTRAAFHAKEMERRKGEGKGGR